MKCLVTAIGSMSAEAVIGALKRRGDTTVVGCNIHPRDWVAASRRVDGFHQVAPAHDTPVYLAQLLDICTRDGITHIIALTDPEVDALSAQRELFQAIGVTLCLPHHSAVRLARDKLAVYRQFVGHPRIQPIPTWCLQDTPATGLSYPLLAKPRYGRSSEGLHVIADADALRYWQGRLASQDYIVQPLLKGEVFVTDVVLQADGSRSTAVTRQELLRTPNGAGMTVQMHPRHACDALATEVARHIGLHGCINVEFLIVDNQPCVMDINPRFSAGVSFSMLAGYDMVNNHLNCFNGNPIDAGSAVADTVFTRGYCDYTAGTAHAAT